VTVLAHVVAEGRPAAEEAALPCPAGHAFEHVLGQRLQERVPPQVLLEVEQHAVGAVVQVGPPLDGEDAADAGVHQAGQHAGGADAVSTREPVQVPADQGVVGLAPVGGRLDLGQQGEQAGPLVDLAAGDGGVLEGPHDLQPLAGARTGGPLLLAWDAGLLVGSGHAVVGDRAKCWHDSFSLVRILGA
jgi:hypothetical protein